MFLIKLPVERVIKKILSLFSFLLITCEFHLLLCFKQEIKSSSSVTIILFHLISSSILKLERIPIFAEKITSIE